MGEQHQQAQEWFQGRCGSKHHVYSVQLSSAPLRLAGGGAASPPLAAPLGSPNGAVGNPMDGLQQESSSNSKDTTTSNAPTASSSSGGGARASARRGLDRLSGLRELGLDVLSRKTRHERDRSSGSNKSAGIPPKSPDYSKVSPPYSRTNTAEGDFRSPDLSGNSAGVGSTSTTNASIPIPVAPAAGELVRRPAAAHTHSGGNRVRKTQFVLVTQDHETLSRVDISGVANAAAVRERLYSKAHILDDDFSRCTVHLSSVDGSTELGSALSDSELFSLCQQVLDGQCKSAPLFFVSLVDASSYSNQFPDYPSSPYQGSGTEQQQPSRPDSMAETSSSSSLSAPGRAGRQYQHAQQRSPSSENTQPRSTQDFNALPPPSHPMTQRPPSDLAFQPPPTHPSNRRPNSSPSTQNSHQFPSPYESYSDQQSPRFDTDRRSSAGSAVGGSRLQHLPHSASQTQPSPWERRSSAGGSDSGRQDWTQEIQQSSKAVRRQERQSRSEMAAPMSSRLQWDHQQQSYPEAGSSNSQPATPAHTAVSQPRNMYPPANYSSNKTNVQLVGMGPSGPIYRSLPATEQNYSRPRANSASGPGQPSPSSNQYQSNQKGKSQAPPALGPSGFLHFPQPIHHGQHQAAPQLPPRQYNLDHQYTSQNSSQLSPQQGHVSHSRGLRLNLARSVDNLRSTANPPSLPARSPVPSHLMSGSPVSSSQGRTTPFAPPQPPIYESDTDPWRAPVSTSMRSSASDMGTTRDGKRTVPDLPALGGPSRIPGPVPGDQRRIHSANASPRMPSQPPYTASGHRVISDPPHRSTTPSGHYSAMTNLSPPQQHHFRRPHPSAQNSYPQPGQQQFYHHQQQQQYPSQASRRPSSDTMEQSALLLQQKAGGPRSIPLRPGETLQEAMEQQHLMREEQTHPSMRHVHGNSNEPRQPYVRSATFEDRQASRLQGEQSLQGPQYTDGQFTASPPLAYAEYRPYSPQNASSHSPPYERSSMTSQQLQPQQQQRPSNGLTKQNQSEPPRSPDSSRHSASSDNANSSRDERPPSFSSSSTNEIATPVSDTEGQHRIPPSPAYTIPGAEKLSPGGYIASKTSSPLDNPRVAEGDDETNAVEILHNKIDAVTDPTASSSHTGGRIKSPYLSALDGEEYDVVKAREAQEWANIFLHVNGEAGQQTPPGSGKGRSGSSGEQKRTSQHDSDEDEDEDEDTLGKTQKEALLQHHQVHREQVAHSSGAGSPAAKMMDDTRESTPRSMAVTEPTRESTTVADSAPPVRPPSPAFSFVDDENDDVQTWNVQMQPTKTAEEKVITKPASTAEREGQIGQQDGQAQRSQPYTNTLPEVSRPDTPTSTSSRLEKPHLRVQTSLNPKTGVKSHDAKSGNTGEAGRTPSPRSNARRRQTSTDDYHSQKQRSGQHVSPAAESAAYRRLAPNALSAERPGSAGASVDRRASFKDDAWAFRPPVEQVYENLEEFFPGHDLDKPIVDAGVSGPNSAIPSPAFDSAGLHHPQSPSSREGGSHHTNSVLSGGGSTTPRDASPTPLPPPLPPVSAVPSELSRRFNSNRKSMRMVAQDRKSRMKREERAAQNAAGTSKDNDKLARRKSTKLWGRRIEEVTPAQAEAISSARTDSPAVQDHDKERDDPGPAKWVRGELIGKGTYGHVYLGFNVTNGEMIAVKRVELPRTASDKDDGRQLSVIEALKSEMELLKDLEHEKIVSYLGFEETPEHLSIILEYVPGGSVGRCLRKHGKFEEEVIQFFTTQILEGLEYLHQRGILHRDLKADNILVKLDGTIKISDFGISKKSNDIYNNNSAMSMQGSIFWMAPEVVHNERRGYSAKIDIWSLGCVVLEMFAGRRPWDSVEAIAAMIQLGSERRAPPVPKDVTLSNQAAHFLKECFHADPDKRPTAGRLLCHKFLTLDTSWDFPMSKLFQAMSELLQKQARLQAKYNKAVSS